ncbi:MAG: hypothetical protein BKP49_05165 [Treponema sp. CETP13]|nr:MAG: hypothetical protein BKP49_05165 [Treponema sp. CETP13]
MTTKYFKTNDRKFLKLDYDYTQDSFSPRDPEYQSNLGTMVFPKERNRRYTLGDKQPESFDEFFKEELSEKEAHDFMEGTNDLDDGAIYNDGFIYVDKDNKEVLNELKGEARDKEGNVYNRWKAKTPEETKAWAEANLRSEIKEYASYLEGNVYDVSVYEFEPKTMDWGEPVVGYNFLITDDVEKYISENNEYSGKIEKEIHSEVMKEIENTPTPEYKEASFENFKTKIRKVLPEFDGNLQHAARAVTIALKDNPSMLENQRDCACFYQSDKTDKNKLDTTLMFVYRQEKDRQLQRDQKKLEKSYEISR